jgi:hypothetical protein
VVLSHFPTGLQGKSKWSEYPNSSEGNTTSGLGTTATGKGTWIFSLIGERHIQGNFKSKGQKSIGEGK